MVTTNDSDDEDAGNEQLFQEWVLAGLKEQPMWRVYPNPNSGSFRFQSDLPHFETGILYLYSIQGLFLGSWEVQNGSIITLKASENSPGVIIGKLYANDTFLGQTKILVQ